MTTEFKQFVTCHCHPKSLDSASTPEAFAKRETELNSGYITATDHGSLAAAREIVALTKKKNDKGERIYPLTPIVGIEAYFRDDDDEILIKEGIPKGEDGTYRDTWCKYFHLTIHFLDQAAYECCVRLLSRADLTAERHGHERKPIFNWADLIELARYNVTMTTGCLIGIVQRNLLEHSSPKIAIKYYEKLRSVVGPGRFFVEVFPHKTDKNWVQGIFVQLADGTKLRYHDKKWLRVIDEKGEIEDIRASDLASRYSRKGFKVLSLVAVKDWTVWNPYPTPNARITQAERIEGYMPNECRPWAPDGDVQAGCNKFMIIQAQRHGDPIIIGDDSHFAHPNEKIAQDIKLMASGGSWRFYSSYHRQSSQEAFEHFQETLGIDEKTFAGWVENSLAWASRFKSFKLESKPSLPTKFYPEDTLAHTMELIKKHGRMDWEDQAMRERLDYEIKLLHDNGTIDLLPYFFVEEEVCDLYAKQQMLTGPGRGSAAGLLLAYLLGITHVDPIKYGLSVDRFITLDRIKSGKLPDIDQDLPDRDLLLNPQTGWLRQRFGTHYAQISTDTKMKLRLSVKDVHRALKGFVPPDVEELTKRFENAPQGVEDHDHVFGYKNGDSWVQGSIERDPALKQYIAKYPKEWEIVQMCLGLTRNKGRHACLPGTELISLSDGTFGEIKECHNRTIQTGQRHQAKAKLLIQGNQPVFEFTLNNQRKFRSTMDHNIKILPWKGMEWMPIGLLPFLGEREDRPKIFNGINQTLKFTLPKEKENSFSGLELPNNKVNGNVLKDIDGGVLGLELAETKVGVCDANMIQESNKIHQLNIEQRSDLINTGFEIDNWEETSLLLSKILKEFLILTAFTVDANLRDMIEKIPLSVIQKKIVYQAVSDVTGSKAILLDMTQCSKSETYFDNTNLEIVGIRYLGILPVYDLSLEHDDHSFLHASGIVAHNCAFGIANRPIDEFIPMTTVSDIRVTQYTAESVEESGVIKYDFLGINSLKDISDCLAIIRSRSSIPIPDGAVINKRWVPKIRLIPFNGELLDVYDLPSDQKVFDDIASGRTETVFQFNTSGAKKWMRHFNHRKANGNKAIDSVEAMAAFTALDRPGPLDAEVTNPEDGSKHNMLVEYARRARGAPKSPDIFPIFEQLLPETYGVMVFQEQLQRVYQNLVGCSGSDAEEFRSNVAKKKVEKVLKAYPKFIEGATAKLGSKEDAQKAWEFINTWGRYGFNKSHAVCYSLIGYICAWLKRHFPLEWWTAVLRNADKNEINDTFWHYCGHLIDLPDLRLSGEVFEIQGNKIRAPISLLDGVGPQAHEQLMAGRPYVDIQDFCDKIQAYKVTHTKGLTKTGKTRLGTSALNRGVVYRLIISGVMDSLFPVVTKNGDPITYLDMMEMFEEAMAKAIAQTTKKKLKIDAVDPRYINLDMAQRYQHRKKTLPAYSAPMLPLVIGKDDRIVNAGKRYHFNSDSGKSIPFATATEIARVDAHRPFPDQSITVAIIGYVESIRQFTYSGNTKTAYEYNIQIDGGSVKFVRWQRKNGSFNPALAPEGSIVVAEVTKFAEDRPFAIDNIEVIYPPISD